jgi:hypothetical protein
MSKSFQASSLVTLEHFFEGNTQIGSIGCNLDDHPGIPKFYEMLKRIRSRKDVQDVLVFISESPDESGTDWAFSDRIYVITCAGKAAVADWLKPLSPDPIEDGWGSETPSNVPAVKPGMKVFFVWWD